MIGSLVLALQLYAAPAIKPVEVTPSRGVRTLEQATRQLRTFNCKVTDEAFGDPRTLVFRTEGGRGYRNKAGQILTTSLTWNVIEDGTGILKDLRFYRPTVPVGIFVLPFSDETRRSKAEIELSYRTPDRPVVMITDRRTEKWSLWTGFCSISSVAQAPLSADETLRYLSQ